MGGAFKNYSVVHYNNEALKADQIYEFLSIYEWNFMEELSRIFPFVLHGQKIMPPRIEIYYTDIEYSEKYCDFGLQLELVPIKDNLLMKDISYFLNIGYLNDMKEMNVIIDLYI